MYNDYTYRVEKELAMMLASVSHHLHPEIVSYIKNKNLEFKSEFESYSHPKLNIEDFLFDGSDCLFPGLRRPVNKEKTTKKWKNNINEIDGTIFNDNTYPRHVWSFLTLNKSYSSTTWKESGLNAFELAHIFGHKIDETDLEKRVFDKFNINRNPYSLFTSASNVVLIPKGLTKPTDKLESIKLCYYRRHIELYGENFYNMSGFKNEMVPEWYNEIIWLDPILPKEWKLKIENLLDYRSKHLELKYQGFVSVRTSNKEVVSSNSIDETKNNEQSINLLRNKLNLAVQTKKITPSESDVISLYFGLDYSTPSTLEEIGIILGISRTEALKIKEKFKNIDSEPIQNVTNIRHISTRFYIDESLYFKLKKSSNSYFELIVNPNKGKHPKGIYLVPNSIILDFIESKMNSYNWEKNKNFSQDGVPKQLRDYFN